MENSEGKICPLISIAYTATTVKCKAEQCAWWRTNAQDCAVPLLAGMFADSDTCPTKFKEAT